MSIVLIVEDEPTHRLLVRKTLENAGFCNNKVFEVENGRLAIEYVYGEGVYANREIWPMPDLILLDIKMPEMDGFEVLEQLKNNPDTESIPVIMLTTSTREEEIAKSYQAGANAYVTKPLDFESFVEKLDALGLFWTVTAEKP